MTVLSRSFQSRMQAIAIVSLFLTLLSGREVNSAGIGQFNEGVKLYNQGNYPAASNAFAAYLKTSPNDPNALYYAALTYHQLKDFAKAKASYEHILAVAPTSAAGRLAANALTAFSPRPSQQHTTAATSSPLATSGFEERSPDYASLPDQARIYFSGDTHRMMIDTQINGRPIPMLFDTGAPSICIGKEQLSQIGVKAPDREPDDYTGGAANAARIPCWNMTADVKVGSVTRRNLPLCVLASNSADPLLGQVFFRDFEYTIDSGSKSILLTKKGTGGGSNQSYKMPFTFRPEGNRVIVKVEVNGVTIPMIFDTGNSAAPVCFSNVTQFEKLGFKIPADARMTRTIGVSGSGEQYAFAISRVKMGPIDRSNVEVTVGATTGSGAEEPLLGLPFIEGWQYTIDMNNKVIHFLRR